MTWERVLCLYPYSPDKKSEQIWGGLAVINPIGLEVVATAAARYAEVMIVDLRLEKRPLRELISEFKPDLIAVSMNWGRDEYINQVMSNLPSDVTIMIGGIAPTRQPEEYLAAFPMVDLLVLGYGEQTITELLSLARPDAVKGLWFRQRPKSWPPAARFGIPEGGVVRNEGHHDVDVSHFHVNRKLRRYKYPFLSLSGDNIATSIGCPMVCAFCGWRTNIYGDAQRWFPRPAADIVEEISETDADVVHIVDANFAHDPKRVEEVCDLLIQRGVNRLLACEIRVNALARNAELVKKMEQAGFCMFMVGIEATDDTILKKLKKGYTVKMCREAFKNLGQTRILSLGNFVIGAPGQSEQDMLYVADYARELGLDFISPNKLYAYPNSTFREWIEEHPGYRIEGRRGYVISDQIGLNKMRQIQRRIFFRFFTPARMLYTYRKIMSHPMVVKLGKRRIQKALLLSMFKHLTDARFRKRLLRKVFGRFENRRRS